MTALALPFKKSLGRNAHPMKNAINPIARVIVKLGVSEFKDNSRNIEKRNITIRGLKIWFFKMLFLFKKPKKFSLGYNFLK